MEAEGGKGIVGSPGIKFCFQSVNSSLKELINNNLTLFIVQ